MSTIHDSYDKKYIAAHAAAQAPAVTLEDETARFGVPAARPDRPVGKTAFAAVAECGDHDVLMWTAATSSRPTGAGSGIDKEAEARMMFIAVRAAAAVA